MGKNKIQYETSIPDDDVEEIIKNLTELLGIKFDSHRFEEALGVEEDDNSKGLCIFRDKSDSDRFIMMDAATPGYIVDLIVRCNLEESSIVKSKIINMINKIYEEEGYDQEDYLQDLDDTYNMAENGYGKALKRCGVAYGELYYDY